MLYRRHITFSRCKDHVLQLKLPHAEKVLKLQGPGRRIWELLEYPLSVDDLVERLAAEFSGSRETIAGDTKNLLHLLLEKKLIEQRTGPASPEERQRFRYLGLLKRCLLNLIYPEHELRIKFLEKYQGTMEKVELKRYLRDIRYREPALYEKLIDDKQYFVNSSIRFAHTMIALSALDNIERCVETLVSENIDGDFLEAGVCQGGAVILMRALQTAYGQGHRKTWAADSFQGLPKPRLKPDLDSGLDFSESSQPSISCSLEEVKDNFLKYDLLDDGVEFLPGWFSETLPDAPVKQLALLRLDADMYASTMEALRHLYPRLVTGGFVIIDDYGYFKFCRQAVDEYRSQNGIHEPMHFVNPTVVCWRKEA